MASNLQSSINQVLGTAVAGKKADELVQAKAKQEQERNDRIKRNKTKQALLDERLKSQQYDTIYKQQRALRQKTKLDQAYLQKEKSQLALDRVKQRLADQQAKKSRTKKSIEQGGYINGNN